jgi:hypothetical protein
MPTFADRGVSHGQRGGSPTAVNLGFQTGAATFFLSSKGNTNEINKARKEEGKRKGRRKDMKEGKSQGRKEDGAHMLCSAV